MTNEEMKKLFKDIGLSQYEVATMIGVSEFTICRWFRAELPEHKQKEIISCLEEHIVEKIKKLENILKKLEVNE